MKVVYKLAFNRISSCAAKIASQCLCAGKLEKVGSGEEEWQ
jgi:hypothetical protein